MIALLFPGQGSGFIGMGEDLLQSEEGRSFFNQADDILGFPLSEIIRHGPQDRLARTDVSQPAIFCVSIAYLSLVNKVLNSASILPKYVAGHSLGEYTALVAAGAISFSEGLRLVNLRGKLMQNASDENPGGMAVVLGLPIEDVRMLCEKSGAHIANINSTDQIVVSGPEEAIARTISLSAEYNVRRIIPLEVSGAFHTHLMEPARVGLANEVNLAQITDPSIPIVANTTALPISSPNAVRKELSEQLCSCVLWLKTIEYMASNGVKTFLEIGPGKVLSNLNKRIAPNVNSISLGSLDAIGNLKVS